MARGAAPLAMEHLKRKPVAERYSRLHCMVLDCSASMVANGALARAKGVLLGLMQEAYQRREHVAMICFGGAGVELRVPPAKAVAWNDDWIAAIGGGGGTPLAAALRRAQELVTDGARRPGFNDAWLWLLTDARTREQPERPAHMQQAWIIDFEHARVPLGRARALAARWDAHYVQAPLQAALPHSTP